MSVNRHICLRCSSSFHPELVRGACPVCRTPVDGHAGATRTVRADDRLLLLVGLATLANLLVLSVTAITLL
jgi:hypothetical protein